VTCHVGFSSAAGAVVVCDSQLSTSVLEVHGSQKLFVGDDFLVSGAGHAGILAAVFEELRSGTATNNSSLVPATFSASCLEKYMAGEVVDAARGTVQFGLATLAPPLGAFQVFDPGTFRRLGGRSSALAIGSGASLAAAAERRETALGLFWNKESVADMLVTARDYLEVANESLTVDDKLLAGFLVAGRTYVMGDPAIVPRYTPPEVQNNWPKLSAEWRETLALVDAIRGEMKSALGTFSLTIAGVGANILSAPIVTTLRTKQDAINTGKKRLEDKLTAFMSRYDVLLGRK
jgi:20S proteasome alpha/beta subunit